MQIYKMFQFQHGLIYFAAGLIVMFLLMRGCSDLPESTIEYLPGITHYDTIYQYDTIQIIQPRPYRVEVYRPNLPDTVRPDYCDSVRDYRSGLDSAGINITVASKVNGLLLSQEITYRLPQVNASRVDTVRVNTSRNYRYGLGVLTNGSGYEIIGQYGIARNVMLMGGYGSDKSVRIGAGVRF